MVKMFNFLLVLNIQDEKQPLSNLKNYNSNNLKKEENKIPTEMISEQRLADEEHYKCIVKALQKAIDENEDVINKKFFNFNFKFKYEFS
jgi:hypothetical protein